MTTAICIHPSAKVVSNQICVGTHDVHYTVVIVLTNICSFPLQNASSGEAIVTFPHLNQVRPSLSLWPFGVYYIAHLYLSSLGGGFLPCL